MASSTDMRDRIRFVELVAELVPRNATLDVNVAPSLPRPLAEMTDADWGNRARYQSNETERVANPSARDMNATWLKTDMNIRDLFVTSGIMIRDKRSPPPP
jgi:hypothetical protein